MKHRKISLPKELEIRDKNSDNKLYSNIYWFACSYYSPFMPMIDLTFAFDELKKLLKTGLQRKYIRIYREN